MKWLDGNRIAIDVPKRPKKITGTRFATILGKNKWSTDFEAWCDITKTYVKPFEDTIYTIAGKTIEPKQAVYWKKAFPLTNIVSPTDIYGEDYFQKTRGDFFSEISIFGGMWDYLLCDERGNPTTVLEMKTTKRIEDWQNDIPENYALQAALYAYLLEIDEVIMVASFLEEKDYKDPSQYEPSLDNTIFRRFKVSERYPDMEHLINRATKWWNDTVLTGISPTYDEQRDKDILNELRTNNIHAETDIQALLQEGEDIKIKIEKLTQPITPLEKRLKTINTMIKDYAQTQFREGDTKVIYQSDNLEWVIAKTQVEGVNKELMKKDEVYDKYKTIKNSYRITTKNKEQKEGINVY